MGWVVIISAMLINYAGRVVGGCVFWEGVELPCKAVFAIQLFLTVKL